MQGNFDHMGAAAGKYATYGGGATAAWFGLSASEIAAVIGAIVAIAGWLTQVYFSRKRERREAEEHAARMARMLRVGDPADAID